MTKEEFYEIWAPSSSVWSAWVKPVLFAFALPWDGAMVINDENAIDIGLDAAADGSGGMVVDLPGGDSVVAGMKLASLGYRPIPMFNAIPDSADSPLKEAVGMSRFALVDVRPIVLALARHASEMAALPLADDAPPAFLLDSNRRIGEGVRSPGRFDNRSISLPTDFPSATFLLSRGIRSVTVVQATGTEPQADLAHTLRRWQEEGIQVFVKSLDRAGEPLPVTVRRPSGFKMLWYNFLAVIGLTRSSLGGFGGRLPSASGG